MTWNSFMIYIIVLKSSGGQRVKRPLKKTLPKKGAREFNEAVGLRADFRKT